MCPHTYAEAFVATTLCFREMSYKLSRHQGLNAHSPGLEKLVCSCRELLACSGHIVCLSLLIAFKRFSGQNWACASNSSKQARHFKQCALFMHARRRTSVVDLRLNKMKDGSRVCRALCLHLWVYPRICVCFLAPPLMRSHSLKRQFVTVWKEISIGFLSKELNSQSSLRFDAAGGQIR